MLEGALAFFSFLRTGDNLMKDTFPTLKKRNILVIHDRVTGSICTQKLLGNPYLPSTTVQPRSVSPHAHSYQLLSYSSTSYVMQKPVGVSSVNLFYVS